MISSRYLADVLQLTHSELLGYIQEDDEHYLTRDECWEIAIGYGKEWLLPYWLCNQYFEKKDELNKGYYK